MATTDLSSSNLAVGETLNKMAATDTLEVMIGKEDELLLFDDENGKQDTAAIDIEPPKPSHEEPAAHQNGSLQHQYHSVQLSIDAEADEFNDEPAKKASVDVSEPEAQSTAAATATVQGDSMLTNETLDSSATGGVIDLEISSKLNDEDEEEAESGGVEKQQEEVAPGEPAGGQLEEQENGAPSGDSSHSHQPPHLTPQIAADFKYLYRNTRYFVIKSFNYENVNIAKEKSVWSTPRLNEIKLTKAYRECANVLLIFSVAESGRFQGFARLASECEQDPDLQVKWVLPPSMSGKSLLGVFKLDWITKHDLEFTKTQHLLNPWNEHRPVKIGRDGQEVEPRAGESLCRLFELSPSSEQSPESMDAEQAAKYNECLASAIVKSKQRHNELAAEAENRRRGGQTNGGGENKAEDDDGDKSSSSRGAGESAKDGAASRSSAYQQTRSNGGSSASASNIHTTNGVGQSSSSSSSYRRTDNYQQQPYSSGQQQSFSRVGGTGSSSGLVKKRHHDDHSNNNNYNYNNQGGYSNRGGGYQAPYGQYNHQQHLIGAAPSNPMAYQQQQQQQPNAAQPQSSYSSSYDQSSSSRHRRRSSSPKKRRTSPNYLPVPKEIVLNGTYEDYLAQVRAAQSQQQTVGYVQQPGMPYSNNGYPQAYDPYQSAQMGMAPTVYGYGQPMYDAYGNLVPQTGSMPSGGHVSKDKYDEDVEAFLRRTTTGASSSSDDKRSSHRHYDDRDRDRDRTHRSSKSKDRDRERDRDRDRDRRHRSGSRDRGSDRSNRRRSKERR